MISLFYNCGLTVSVSGQYSTVITTCLTNASVLFQSRSSATTVALSNSSNSKFYLQLIKFHHCQRRLFRVR